MTDFSKYERAFLQEESRHRRKMRQIQRQYYLGLAVIVIVTLCSIFWGCL